jgi:Flp pilus assembly protein TadG
MAELLRKRHCRGAATVEVAIVFPLLLMITLGAIHYGWLFLKAQQLTNAARMGARTAIRPDATVSVVNSQVNALMTAAGISGYTTTCLSEGTVITDIALDVNTPVTVRITVPAANVNIIPMPFVGPETWNLGAEVTMAKEGF